MRIFICEELINNLESNINKIKKIESMIDKNNGEAYFIYAFALFESALFEAIRHMFRAFPEKINSKKQLILSAEEIYSNIFSPQDIFETLVENEIKKESKGSAKIVVEKAENICAIKLSYEVKRLDNISAKRNQITHENTPSRQSDLNEDFKSDIAYLLDLLAEFSLRIKERYSKYTKYKMLKDFWSILFDTPLLVFENCVFLRKDFMDSKSKIVGFNFDYIKKASKSISSSEKFFLSIILQQYSQNINEGLFKFSDIPMLISISDKKKIYIFLHVMAIYPYLFNGMNIEEASEED